MRATKGYLAGMGTTTALIGAIGCAFAILSAAVAVHGWPLALGDDTGEATLDGRVAPPSGTALLRPGLLGRTGDGAAVAAPARRGAARRLMSAPGDPRALAGERPAPRLAAPAPAAGGSPRGQMPAAAGARSHTATPAPRVQPGAPPPPGGGTGATSALGGAITRLASGAGGAVTQAGQQLGGSVQGATQQLGSAAGQVSPAVGQTVTQAGQVAGGVVSGATGTVGQVVTGAGTAVGGLLGGASGG